ncbi:MAG: cation:proton antiporter [Rhodocyclaceae bacterium]|nr:cation:proton antiporter [Rhodocyclaceae bacterium]
MDLTTMAAEHHGLDLLPFITLLAAGVIGAPLFKRLGLGSVLGYLAGGIAIGPFGLQVFNHPAEILQVAELGVVLFLFIVGLEMRPSRLWRMRHQIFGLGLVQVLVCALLLTAVGVFTGFPVALSFVSGAGFVLTSTAIVMLLLEERGQLGSPAGQRAVSILLLEDLIIVPLLALVAFLAPVAAGRTGAHSGIDLAAIGIGLGSIAALILAGRYLLNPLFRLLASAHAREVLTAAALLVVLGAAYAIESGGLSMAMGAFLAGVMLSESSYRHQLEADIEPFRGILLGLIFLAVGMSLDLAVVAAHWHTIVFYVIAYMIVKALGIYAVARLFRAAHGEALDRAVVMAQGGEFAFVLYAAATSAGIVNAEQNAMLTAIIILSMALTPLAIAGLKRVRVTQGAGADTRELPDSLTGAALVIGFGRVGQIVAQFLLARGRDISIIDTDVEMIDIAREHDFKVYYGDGTRLDVLHAAGAASARLVIVCVDGPEAGTQIVELLKAEFAHAPVLARARDRVHRLALIRAGADLQVRETFESAVSLGMQALHTLGASDVEIAGITESIRKRDQQRLELEIVGGIAAGGALFSGRDSGSDRVAPPRE